MPLPPEYFYIWPLYLARQLTLGIWCLSLIILVEMNLWSMSLLRSIYSIVVLAWARWLQNYLLFGLVPMCRVLALVLQMTWLLLSLPYRLVRLVVELVRAMALLVVKLAFIFPVETW